MFAILLLNPIVWQVLVLIVSTLAQVGLDPAINAILVAMEKTVSRCEVEAGQLSGVGVGAAGVIDDENDRIIFFPSFLAGRECFLEDIDDSCLISMAASF